MRRSYVFVSLPLVALLLGCGAGEGMLILRLARAGFDDPYAGLDRFEVRVLDPRYQQLEQRSAPAAGDALDLGLTGAGERRLVLRGLDDAGHAVSGGHSRLLALTEGEVAVEPIPFSTAQVAVALPAARALPGGRPTLDGDLNEWAASPALVLEGSHRVAGPIPAALDLRAELALAWEADRLHMALRVTDDCPALKEGAPAGGCGAAAAVERVFLGLDGTDDGGTAYGAHDHWVEIKATRLWVRQGDLKPDQITVVLAPLPDGRGWVLEGTLKASALGRASLDAGSKVGLELVLVDEDPGQGAPTVLRWSGAGPADPSAPTPPDQLGTLGFATSSAP